ncbi:GTP cyclohydrolase [Robertkochia marina]|uniref:GTP cyclohydrolase n=1 Tax=Robertkochia marina TaxID=1227945 RepID=A0A4S3M2I3_9FLAO|nr:GNAT family N-acetyltransferase [Robertkochia marina]THD67819.1 GTP cyclohydrolase [Robertkochia marina]TRZ41708.1 GTP cyclohydrolase [Robertkochia marina]
MSEQSVTVKEITSRKDLEKFVKFPFSLYKNSPYWVPPIIKEEVDNFDPEKNPAYQEADAWFYMAYKQGKPVGRIAVIVNWPEVKEMNKPKIRFGWFEAVNDAEVTSRLFQKVAEKGAELGLKYIEGPAGFTNMDKAGMLLEGFDRPGSMSTYYNPAYYNELLEKEGFTKEIDWKEYEIDVPKGIPDKVAKFSGLIMKKFGFKLLRFKSNKELLPQADRIFDLMNKTYSSLQSFTPIKPYQIAHYKEKFLKFIHPDYISLIEDKNGDLVAFSVVMPSFTEALQKANGKLFPFGFYHLMKAMKTNDKATLLLIGVHPDYTGKGVTAIIFKEVIELFNRKGIKVVETNPELETNNQIQALWKDYDPRLIKKWRTYRKELS